VVLALTLPGWANIQELQGQSNGDVDVPFALQWARRSHLFSFTNLTVWGLGLPLGILAWAGFLWMAWRTSKGELRNALLWAGQRFILSAILAFNPTMRYQLPIYPLLCMMAGWFVISLWDAGRKMKIQARPKSQFYSLSSLVIGSLVLLLTGAWAYAFTRIYTRPVTRVAATYWIYQNVPAAINLHIKTTGGSIYQEPLSFPPGGLITSDQPYVLPFTANAAGLLTDVYFPHIAASGVSGADGAINVQALNPTGGANKPALQTLSLSVDLQPGSAGNQSNSATSLTSILLQTE